MNIRQNMRRGVAVLALTSVATLGVGTLAYAAPSSDPPVSEVLVLPVLNPSADLTPLPTEIQRLAPPRDALDAAVVPVDLLSTCEFVNVLTTSFTPAGCVMAFLGGMSVDDDGV